MKRILVFSVLFLLTIGIVGFSLPAASQAADMKSYLMEKYGWTINLPEKSNWDITCPEGRDALPKQDGRTRFNWVCQRLGLFRLTIVWRLVKPAVLEEDVIKGYVGKYSYNKACNTEKIPSAVDPEGVFVNCALVINGNDRHMAFYHFQAKMSLIPGGFTLVDSYQNKVENLGFTIHANGGVNPDSGIGGKLKELIAAIQAPTIQAAKQQ
jgi:hypothetical protein